MKPFTFSIYSFTQSVSKDIPEQLLETIEFQERVTLDLLDDILELTISSRSSSSNFCLANSSKRFQSSLLMTAFFCRIVSSSWLMLVACIFTENNRSQYEQRTIILKLFLIMTSGQRGEGPISPESIQRTDSQQGALRKTYFRLRQIKQNVAQSKIVAMSSPKRHNDFYSHQQAAIQHFRGRDKIMSNTTSNFFANTSKMGRMGSIQQGQASPHSQMRKTFFNKRSTSDKTPEKQAPSSLLFGRTSLNFHKQDIFKNENSNNYLNKYKIVKELGKGSYSTVFLAKKQVEFKGPERSSSPLQLNPELELSQDQRNPQSCGSSHLWNQNDKSLDEKSNFNEYKVDDRFPRLSQPEVSNLQTEDQSNLYAIKVYQKFKMNKDPHKFKNIRKQINIMQNLDNEGVVKLYESVETLTKISLVVEYGGKQSLLEYVKHNYPLEMERVKDISFQLIKAINYIHEKNIVHRDIKLQNVLINQDKIKLIDFGFSCLTHKQQKLTVICGTPNYMAPEVISRKQYIGEQADIWSYGVVVYALAEGRHPFKAETYSELERLVNRGKFQFKKTKQTGFIEFVKRILKVKGSDRPTAREIMQMRWFKNCQN